MRKASTIAIALAVGSALAIPASAQEAPAGPTTIPETVQIEDPLGDANGLNDQGNRAQTGFQGDHTTPADAGSVSDMMKVWFSHDETTARVHFLTEAAPPATNSLLFQVYSNPGGDYPQGCLRWAALIPGVNYVGDPVIKLIDRCNDDGTNFYSNGQEGTFTIETTAEENGILTLSFPREYSPLLADDLWILSPFAEARVVTGEGSTVGNVSAPMLDNTIEGADYVPPPPPTDVTKYCPKKAKKKKGCRKP